ncbi:hypothetical protein ACWCOW_41420, partial [Streptomyces sp. NPDC001939]
GLGQHVPALGDLLGGGHVGHGRSRAHHAATVADRARRTLKLGKVALLPTTTHHSLPLTAPKQLNDQLLDFLG